MEKNIIKTKCDFCGKEIECPKEMINLKQSCFNCFKNLPNKMGEIPVGKLHIDVNLKEIEQMNEFIAMNIFENVFPAIWKRRDDELKTMDKKEASKEMFMAGVLSTLDYVNESLEERKKNQ